MGARLVTDETNRSRVPARKAGFTGARHQEKGEIARESDSAIWGIPKFLGDKPAPGICRARPFGVTTSGMHQVRVRQSESDDPRKYESFHSGGRGSRLSKWHGPLPSAPQGGVRESAGRRLPIAACTMCAHWGARQSLGITD